MVSLIPCPLLCCPGGPTCSLCSPCHRWPTVEPWCCPGRPGLFPYSHLATVDPLWSPGAALAGPTCSLLGPGLLTPAIRLYHLLQAERNRYMMNNRNASPDQSDFNLSIVSGPQRSNDDPDSKLCCHTKSTFLLLHLSFFASLKKKEICSKVVGWS